MKTGIELIAEERKRQIEKEGYTKEHDEEHRDGELAVAACCYATPTILYQKEDYANTIHFDKLRMDWELKLPYRGNVLLDNDTLGKPYRLKQLIKAGALIAAEIDRLQNQQTNEHK